MLELHIEALPPGLLSSLRNIYRIPGLCKYIMRVTHSDANVLSPAEQETDAQKTIVGMIQDLPHHEANI